jgi:hypothetical protein
MEENLRMPDLNNFATHMAFNMSFGEKLSTLPVTLSIESTCGQKPTRLFMRYGEERGPQSSISGFLEVSATSFETEKIWENLIPNVMKEYSWDTPPTVMLIGYSTKEQELWWNQLMW